MEVRGSCGSEDSSTRLRIVVRSGKSELRSQRGVGVFQLGIAVLLLAVLGMLLVNVYVLWTAKDYNKRICEDAAMAAGKAAIQGKPTRDVLKDAMEAMEMCGMGGYFIERPVFTNFRDDIKAELRKLTIEMQTKVHLPAPYLVFDNSVSDGVINVKDVYVYNVKNPKNCKEIQNQNSAANAKQSSKSAGKEATGEENKSEASEKKSEEHKEDSSDPSKKGAVNGQDQ